jgi:hypothetical protein
MDRTYRTDSTYKGFERSPISPIGLIGPIHDRTPDVRTSHQLRRASR